MLKALLFVFSSAAFAAPNYQGCFRPQAAGYCGFYATTFRAEDGNHWLQISYMSLPDLSDPVCDSAPPFLYSLRKDGNFWDERGEHWIPRGTTLISPAKVVNIPTACH